MREAVAARPAPVVFPSFVAAALAGAFRWFPCWLQAPWVRGRNMGQLPLLVSVREQALALREAESAWIR
jgi:hypothetical protein